MLISAEAILPLVKRVRCDMEDGKGKYPEIFPVVLVLKVLFTNLGVVIVRVGTIVLFKLNSLLRTVIFSSRVIVKIILLREVFTELRAVNSIIIEVVKFSI